MKTYVMVYTGGDSDSKEISLHKSMDEAVDSVIARCKEWEMPIPELEDGFLGEEVYLYSHDDEWWIEGHEVPE